MSPEAAAPTGAQAVDQVLKRLQRRHPQAVLSGDWAARQRLGSPAAYRLELIVGPEDLESLAGEHPSLESPPRPGHRRLLVEGVEVRLLLAGEAQVGERLRIPAAALAEQAELAGESRRLSLEGILACRLAGLLDRPDTKLAERDRVELWGLLAAPAAPDWDRLAWILRRTGQLAAEQGELLAEAFARLAELGGLEARDWERLLEWRRQALEALARRQQEQLLSRQEQRRRYHSQLPPAGRRPTLGPDDQPHCGPGREPEP